MAEFEDSKANFQEQQIISLSESLSEDNLETTKNVSGLVPLDQNPAAIYLATLRPTGRRTMRQALNTVAAIASSGKCNDALLLNWHELRYQHTAAIAAYLREEYHPATVNKMLSAMRRVLKEAWRLGLMEAEDYRRAADIPSVKNQSLPKGRALDGTELKALLSLRSAKTTPKTETNPTDESAETVPNTTPVAKTTITTPEGTARDAALVAVLYGSGLRRSEVVKLNLADYQPKKGLLTIRGAKGGKDRTTYLGDGARKALAAWLAVRGDASGPLFCPVNRGGKVIMRQMRDQSVLDILHRMANAAGVENFSPHDLRRTFISDLLDAGADIATVAKLAGHSQVQTTARYDRRGEKAKQKAAELLQIPFPD